MWEAEQFLYQNYLNMKHLKVILLLTGINNESSEHFNREKCGLKAIRIPENLLAKPIIEPNLFLYNMSVKNGVKSCLMNQSSVGHTTPKISSNQTQERIL